MDAPTNNSPVQTSASTSQALLSGKVRFRTRRHFAITYKKAIAALFSDHIEVKNQANVVLAKTNLANIKQVTQSGSMLRFELLNGYFSIDFETDAESVMMGMAGFEGGLLSKSPDIATKWRKQLEQLKIQTHLTVL